MPEVTLPAGIREAGPDDVPALLEMVLDLADYERARDQVRMEAGDLEAALFGPDAVASALIAEDARGRVLGMALWYRTFSTWEGVPGMHLEDLYVRPDARGAGLGRRLLVALAGIARTRGFTRLEWDVLRWNSPAIAFYESLQAQAQDGWLGYRLDRTALDALAHRDKPTGQGERL